jgi:hypothetical protein
VPYLAHLNVICGDVFEPASCLIVCFALVTLGVWSVMALGREHRRAHKVSAAVFGVTLVAAGFPVVFFSEAWISCSLSDDPARSANATPAPALWKASLLRRFSLI